MKVKKFLTILVAFIITCTFFNMGGEVQASASRLSSSTSKKIVALTFDDGPSITTPKVLDVLEKYNVKASFFLIGSQINSSTQPIMQRAVNLGCELANHSWSHSYMDKMTADEVKKEINDTSKAIKDAVGYEAKFFRPPYIAVSDTMYNNIDLPFICGVGCDDWDSSVSVTKRIKTIVSNVKDGDIILLHDFEGNDNTVKALPSIIRLLKIRGYEFVTISDLFKLNGVNPNVKYKIWTNVKE